jgi:hypothetical protein
MFKSHPTSPVYGGLRERRAHTLMYRSRSTFTGIQNVTRIAEAFR